MYGFLKANSLTMVRRKLLALYLLNVTDALLTHFLLKTDLFAEANILLQGIVADTPAFLSLKILLPWLLISVLCRRLRGASNRQLQLGNILVNIAIIFYALVNALHLLWVLLCATVLLFHA